MSTLRIFGFMAVALLMLSGGAQGQGAPSPAVSRELLSGPALVAALKRGGYVLVMRHASSPRDVPDERTANPDNTTRERQLDADGRASATAFGNALRALAIPIGEVLTSPTYRALETVRMAGLTSPVRAEQLGDGGQSMQSVTDANAMWLRARVAQLPGRTNTLLVTHMPNLARAFPQAGPVADGEILVFGEAAIIARIPIGEWPSMAAR